MADIFLSYASEDRERVRPLVATLEELGLSIWWDRSIVPGTQFEREIEHEINKAGCVVVIWSQHSIGSHWVQGEAAEGLARGVLVPVLLDNVRPPLLFRHHDAVDFRSWHGEVDHPEIERLSAGIEAATQGRGRHDVSQVDPVERPGKSTKPAWRAAALSLLALIAVAAVFWQYGTYTNSRVDNASVAIGEFVNREDGKSNYLGFGLTRQVRDFLGRIEAIKVASRTSTAAISGVDTASLGELLQVAYFVEGSFAGAGDSFDLDVHLVDTKSSLRVWTKRYRGDRSRLLDVAHSVALDLAGAMSIDISSASSRQLEARATNNPEALEQYLIGSELISRPPTAPELDTADAAFHKAISLDPNFTSAYAALCRVSLTRYRQTRDSSNVAKAEEYCEQAIRLDDVQLEPRIALGQLYLISGDLERSLEQFQIGVELAPTAPEPVLGLGMAYERKEDFVRAEDWYRRGIERFPTFWRAHRLLGTLLFNQGRNREAIPIFKKVVSLSPNSASSYVDLGAANFMIANFDEALEAWEKAQSFEETVLGRSNTGTAYFFLSRFDEAKQMYQRATELSPRDFRLWGQLGDVNRLLLDNRSADEAYGRAVALANDALNVNPRNAAARGQLAAFLAHLGDTQGAQREIDQATALADQDYYVRYDVALAYLRMGLMDQARSALSEAIALGYPAHLVKADPQFQQLNL